MTVNNHGLIQHSALTSYTPTACRPVKVKNNPVMHVGVQGTDNVLPAIALYGTAYETNFLKMTHVILKVSKVMPAK